MSRPAELLLAAFLAACSASSEPERMRTVPRCTNPGKGVEGFVLERTREFPGPDRVGVRLEYGSPQGERLYYLIGITGQVGEGLPQREVLVLADGTEARLLGRGPTWALVWQEPGPCGDVQIIGNRMARRRFLEVLRGAGLVPRG